MDVKTYIQENPGAATKLAAELGIPIAYMSQMASGGRSVSPARAVAIEKATNGAVTRQELRPTDWAAIWPELAINVRRTQKQRKVIV